MKESGHSLSLSLWNTSGLDVLSPLVQHLYKRYSDHLQVGELVLSVEEEI